MECNPSNVMEVLLLLCLASAVLPGTREMQDGLATNQKLNTVARLHAMSAFVCVFMRALGHVSICCRVCISDCIPALFIFNSSVNYFFSENNKRSMICSVYKIK